MRYKLLVFFLLTSLAASAQWPFKRQHPVLPRLHQARSRRPVFPKAKPVYYAGNLKPYKFDESEFTVEAQITQLIKLTKHNMSWRIYGLASYNFADLAELYIKINHMSEAKWYLLQSNNISREQNNFNLTISNLLRLAFVKVKAGDHVSARADLVEAKSLASANAMTDKVTEIETRIQVLDQNRRAFITKYAGAPDTSKRDL